MVRRLLFRVVWLGRRGHGSEPSSAAIVRAVRRDWPEGHEVLRARETEAAAQQGGALERAYWRERQARPDLPVVSVSAHDNRLDAVPQRLCIAPGRAWATATMGAAR